MRKILGWLRCNNIDPVYQTNVMSLLNFFTTLKQGFGYVNMQPWIAHILRSLRFLVNLMSELQRCIGVAITTSMICCKANLLPNVETMFGPTSKFWHGGIRVATTLCIGFVTSRPYHSIVTLFAFARK